MVYKLYLKAVKKRDILSGQKNRAIIKSLNEWPLKDNVLS